MGNNPSGDSDAAGRSHTKTKAYPDDEGKRSSAEGHKKGKKGAEMPPRKLVLLGSPQTGKSTFMKQIQINFVTGFGDKDRTDVQRTLAHNLVMGLRDIFDHMAERKIDIPQKIDDEAYYIRTKVDLGDVWRITPDLARNAKAIWKHPDVQKIWADRDAIPNFLIFNLDYIVEHLERFAKEDVVPTNEDILRSRLRTTTNGQLNFEYEKRRFEITDCGGQKNARKQWASAVENPSAVVYFAALSDYDIPVLGDTKLMKLEESLNIFAEIVVSEEFKSTNFILMLNKFDLFEQKLKTKPIQHVKEYKTIEDTDPNAIAKKIAGRFKRRLTEERKSAFSSNVITAIDTEQMRRVFISLRDIIAGRILDEYFA